MTFVKRIKKISAIILIYIHVCIYMYMYISIYIYVYMYMYKYNIHYILHTKSDVYIYIDR